MKKILFALIAITVWVSCSKEGKKVSGELENHCPVVSASAVPTAVLSAFQTTYPKETAVTWFQKGAIGYCAYFIQLGTQRKLAEFTTAGMFVSEKIDIDYDGNFEDSTGLSGAKITTVCECSIPE